MSAHLMEAKANKHVELKKHVGLIHSSGKISLLQRKIANALLFNAYENLLDKEEHAIHINELTNLIGYDSNDHRKIKNALIDLLSTVIEWNIVDGSKIDDNNIWNASSIIADASINGSICTYSYSNKMRSLLYHPQMYGRLNMSIQAKFQSGYGLALYENCNRYRDIGQTPWFDLKKFRKLMGVDDNKYQIFRDLKSRVISQAVEDINKHSDIQLEPRYKKVNRQVFEIQFLINKIKKTDSANKKSENIEKDLNDDLKIKFGLSKSQIELIASQYERNYIEEKIKIITTSKNYLSGKIKNLGKYLMCALKEDYQAIKTSSEINKNQKIDNTNYQKYMFDEILKQFEILEEKDKNPYLNEFDKYMKKNIYFNLYKIHGLKNVLVKEQFVKYMESKQHFINQFILKL